MRATDRSSTRSPGPWAATIRPSASLALAHLALTLAALRALWIAELPEAVLVGAGLCVVIVAARAFRASRRPRRLSLDGDGRWTIETGDGRHHRGRLRRAGYRDAGLIVLVIEDAQGVRRRAAVPADAVDARDFSFLHLALALLADDDAPGGAPA